MVVKWEKVGNLIFSLLMNSRAVVSPWFEIEYIDDPESGTPQRGLVGNKLCSSVNTHIQ